MVHDMVTEVGQKYSIWAPANEQIFNNKNLWARGVQGAKIAM